MRHTAFITLASNINQEDNIAKAVEMLKALPLLDIEISTIVYYPAIDFAYKSDKFANCVIYFSTSLDFGSLKALCHDIEARLGRTNISKQEHPESIYIDIDIIVWDKRVIRKKDFDRQYFLDGFNELSRDKKYNDIILD